MDAVNVTDDKKESKQETPRITDSCYQNLERIQSARFIAEQAARNRKVFRLDGGHRYLRKALLARGWVERFTNRTRNFRVGDDSSFIDMDNDNADNDDTIDDVDDLRKEPEITSTFPMDDFDHMVSRALRDHDPDFQWLPSYRIDFKNCRRETIYNHFPKVEICTKTGLTRKLKNLNWNSDRDADDFYPRCFILGEREGYDSFLEEFRRCAATSFLKHCQEQVMSKVDEFAPGPYVNCNWIDFAVAITQDYYDWQDNDAASTIYRNVSISDEDSAVTTNWNKFIDAFYNVAHKGFKIRGCISRQISVDQALNLYKRKNPQHDIEGKKNLWMVKPGAMSRGRGIHAYWNLQKILDLIGPDMNVIASGKWVAQKYIENPFLIRNVKFDIRQWFIVTDWEQLTIWMYKRAYARFASVPFSLDELNNQIHLTNAAIQRKYDVSEECHEEIPKEKMWTSEELSSHMKTLGYGEIYKNKIFPAMRSILIQSCLAGQDSAETRKKSFELYGADFMLDHNLNPLLIEINQGPSLSTSTSVTKELVENLLEDLCKVVIDKNTSDTGDFVRVYRQAYIECPRYIGNNLTVSGKGYPKPKTSQRVFLREIKSDKKKDKKCEDNNEDSKEEVNYKTCSWDVERINQLAKPRTRMTEEQRAKHEERMNRLKEQTKLDEKSDEKDVLIANNNALQMGDRVPQNDNQLGKKGYMEGDNEIVLKTRRSKSCVAVKSKMEPGNYSPSPVDASSMATFGAGSNSAVKLELLQSENLDRYIEQIVQQSAATAETVSGRDETKRAKLLRSRATSANKRIAKKIPIDISKTRRPNELALSPRRWKNMHREREHGSLAQKNKINRDLRSRERQARANTKVSPRRIIAKTQAVPSIYKIRGTDTLPLMMPLKAIMGGRAAGIHNAKLISKNESTRKETRERERRTQIQKLTIIL